MAEIKEKHPTWFKMKLERRQMIRQLPPENAVNVLLACWDYLETETLPQDLSALESIAVSAFFPDLEDAWARYEQRVYARAASKNVDCKTHVVLTDIERCHATSCETEEETEPDPLKGDGSKIVEVCNARGAAFRGGPPPVQLYDPDNRETWG